MIAFENDTGYGDAPTVIAGARRIVMPFKKEHNGEPVMTPSVPWEDLCMGFWGTVLFDEEQQKFRMWYHAWSTRRTSASSAYITDARVHAL